MENKIENLIDSHSSLAFIKPITEIRYYYLLTVLKRCSKSTTTPSGSLEGVFRYDDFFVIYNTFCQLRNDNSSSFLTR